MGKKAAPKAPLSKIVWQWTEKIAPEDITSEHVYTAYRLRLEKCTQCRKNCVGNPTCLRGLGEALWLRDGNYKIASEYDVNEIKSQIRKDGEFVGLKNLGATCYVNTFLQLWFHNLNIRKAVYSYKEEGNETEKFPYTVCGHLQLIFGMLQSSARKNIDPTPFIKCLSLDTELQQDAQEFSKLVLNFLLDRTSNVGKYLSLEFCGEYDYCTTCKTCGNISKRPSKFYELDLSIQGHKDAIQCLGEFFKEEQLDGENQYYCASCDCKRDASRRIVIKSLPRTLNLQLLRFVFDKTTWNKKKVSSYLSFPDTLDMSSFVSQSNLSAEDMLYELTAVLIHRGPSASSGHYIAHVKDSSTQLWHMFNDETIEKMKGGKKLDLDSMNNDNYDIDLPQAAKKPKLKNKWHSSKDAYMLVYTKRKDMIVGDSKEHIPDVPESLQTVVKADNDEFFSIINASIEEVEKSASEESTKHFEMAKLLGKMHEIDMEKLLSDAYWVPTTWLKHMLNISHTEKSTFTTEKFLCDHKKLNADRVGGMKCIPGFVADHLFAMCKEETPCITNQMLCLKCVKDRCYLLRFKANLKDDHVKVTAMLKDSVEDQYFVGRSSLQQWKTMASKSVESKLAASLDSTALGKENGTNEKVDHNIKNLHKKVEDSDDENDFDFNEDLLCEHGNFTTDVKSFRAVSTSVWDILIKYFPDAPMYKVINATPCQICKDNELDAAQTSELQKITVNQQKKKLHDLFLNKNRPTYENLYDAESFTNTKEPSFYVVSGGFVQQWRDYVKNYTRNEPVSQVHNRSLLCPHDMLCEEISLTNSSNNHEPSMSSLDGITSSSTVLLWPKEWEYVSKNFGVDIPIKIIKNIITSTVISEEEKSTVTPNGEQGADVEKNTFISNEIPQNDEINNNSALIDIENNTNHIEVDTGLVTANITAIKPKENQHEICSKVVLKFEPDFCKECLIGKALEKERSLLNYENQSIYIRRVIPDGRTDLYKQISSMQSENCARKSKRTHTTRGEKKIIVSSNWTLKQLKIKIMELFSIPPFDQNIWSQGRRLEDNSATLNSLSVLPGCTILLVADEPDENSINMLSVVSSSDQILEEGFKGTGLLSS